MRLGISVDELRPIDHISDVGCPVLVASGDLDQHAKLAETQRVFDAAHEPKRLVVCTGADHADLFEFDREKYEREVLTFLADALGRKAETF